MSLLVTGSIGIDSVETPHGKVEDVLGGSSIYFSLAAALFTRVRLVGVVGEDFEHGRLEVLRAKGIDLAGVETRTGSRTFRWQGKYEGAMNEAQTVGVELNVLAERGAIIPPDYHDSRHVFLANTHPSLQLGFAKQFSGANLIVCDTMNLWIHSEPELLKSVLSSVHGLVLNEGEARLLTSQTNLITAGRRILEMGPQFVVIKKGEHGSLLVSRDDLYSLPAYPTERTVDPTGCGDTFAGAMIGYLASQPKVDARRLRTAVGYGTVVASFVIESFSTEALAKVTMADVERRRGELRNLVRMDG